MELMDVGRRPFLVLAVAFSLGEVFNGKAALVSGSERKLTSIGGKEVVNKVAVVGGGFLHSVPLLPLDSFRFTVPTSNIIIMYYCHLLRLESGKAIRFTHLSCISDQSFFFILKLSNYS